MTTRTSFAGLLALTVGAGAALAAGTQTAPSSVTEVLPGAGNATLAGFVNVKRIFALFGDEIESQPQYREYMKYVEQGAPDPRTDIDEIGIVGDLESQTNSAGVAVLGRINGKALLDLIRSQGLTITESAYRGVTVHQAVDARTSVEIAFPTGTVSTLSLVEKGEHVFHQPILDTVAGRIESMQSLRGVRLPDSYLASLTLEVTDKLRAMAQANEMTRPLAASERLTVSLTTRDASKDLDLLVTLRMLTAEDAQGLQMMLEAILGGLAEQASDENRQIIEAIRITVEDRDVTITLAVPAQMLQASVQAAD